MNRLPLRKYQGGGSVYDPYFQAANFSSQMLNNIAPNSAIADFGGGALRGAATGAQIGTMFAPGIGTAIGGAVGLVGGLFGAGAKRKQERIAREQQEAARANAERMQRTATDKANLAGYAQYGNESNGLYAYGGYLPLYNGGGSDTTSRMKIRAQDNALNPNLPLSPTNPLVVQKADGSLGQWGEKPLPLQSNEALMKKYGFKTINGVAPPVKGLPYQPANSPESYRTWNRHYANGGTLPLAADMQKFQGPSHANGGIPLDLNGDGAPEAEVEGGEVKKEEKIYSDRLRPTEQLLQYLNTNKVKVDGTYADVATTLGKLKGKYESKMLTYSPIALRTGKAMTDRMEGLLEATFQDQEMSKPQESQTPMFADGGVLRGNGTKENIYDVLNGTGRRRDLIPTPFIVSSKNEIKLQDKRKVSATSGRKINPNKDLVSGRYPTNRIYDIVRYAKGYGEDPYTAIALDMQETQLGEREKRPEIGYTPPPGQILMDREDMTVPNRMNVKAMTDDEFDDNYGYNDFMLAIGTKNKDARRQGLTKEADIIQNFNGRGKVFPSTEASYHGYNMKQIYGVPIPKGGIDMKKNPLYGKRIIDIRDNVIKKNDDIVSMVDNIQVKKFDKTYPMYADGGLLQDDPDPRYGRYKSYLADRYFSERRGSKIPQVYDNRLRKFVNSSEPPMPEGYEVVKDSQGRYDLKRTYAPQSSTADLSQTFMGSGWGANPPSGNVFGYNPNPRPVVIGDLNQAPAATRVSASSPVQAISTQGVPRVSSAPRQRTTGAVSNPRIPSRFPALQAANPGFNSQLSLSGNPVATDLSVASTSGTNPAVSGGSNAFGKVGDIIDNYGADILNAASFIGNQSRINKMQAPTFSYLPAPAYNYNDRSGLARFQNRVGGNTARNAVTNTSGQGRSAERAQIFAQELNANNQINQAENIRRDAYNENYNGRSLQVAGMNADIANRQADVTTQVNNEKIAMGLQNQNTFTQGILANQAVRQQQDLDMQKALITLASSQDPEKLTKYLSTVTDPAMRKRIQQLLRRN